MQIPYDLEFVENRPAVRVRALAATQPFLGASGDRRRGERDAFDALLSWVHRMLNRIEKPQ